MEEQTKEPGIERKALVATAWSVTILAPAVATVIYASMDHAPQPITAGVVLGNYLLMLVGITIGFLVGYLEQVKASRVLKFLIMTASVAALVAASVVLAEQIEFGVGVKLKDGLLMLGYFPGYIAAFLRQKRV